LAVRGVEVDRYVAQRPAPLDHGGVVVRMGDRDGQNAAQGLDGVDAPVIHQRYAVPQDVAARGPDVEGALAQSELGVGAEADQLRPFDIQLILVAGRLHFLQRGPALPLPRDVLPLVLADGAAVRRSGRVSVLNATGGA